MGKRKVWKQITDSNIEVAERLSNTEPVEEVNHAVVFPSKNPEKTIAVYRDGDDIQVKFRLKKHWVKVDINTYDSHVWQENLDASKISQMEYAVTPEDIEVARVDGFCDHYFIDTPNLTPRQFTVRGYDNHHNWDSLKDERAPENDKFYQRGEPVKTRTLTGRVVNHRDNTMTLDTIEHHEDTIKHHQFTCWTKERGTYVVDGPSCEGQ